MDFLEYKGYKGSVEYSKEDNCLFGKVQGMSKALILYEGNTLEELRKDFEDGVDSYLEACKADGVEPAKPSKTNSSTRRFYNRHLQQNYREVLPEKDCSARLPDGVLNQYAD